MTDEQFAQLNPVLMGKIQEFKPQWQAYLVQGEFLKSRSFIFDFLDQPSVEVLKLRFGMVDGKYWSLQNLSDHFSLSRERIRQMEEKAIARLRHPYRLKMLKEYTDETYKNVNEIQQCEELRGLINQDILTHIGQEVLDFIEDIKIDQLEIKRSGRIKQSKEDIIRILLENNIVTCKDFIVYLQSERGFKDIGLINSSYKYLLYAICDLFDNKNTQKLSREMVRVHMEQRSDSKKLIKAENVKEDLEQKRLKEEQKQKRLSKALTNPEDVLVEDLDFEGNIRKALKEMQINTLADIINHYNLSGKSIRRPYSLGEKREEVILKKLNEMGVKIEYSKAELQDLYIQEPEKFLVEYLDLSLRAYNCLKRAKIDNAKQLIDFYNEHKTLTKISTMGPVIEEEILSKIKELNYKTMGESNDIRRT